MMTEFVQRGIAFAVGLIAALALGVIVPGVMKSVGLTGPLEPPKGVSPQDWEAVTDIGERARKPIRLIGVLEQALFFVSFWLPAYQLAAGWLAFKVASKWETWQSILKVPEAPPDQVHPLDYLAAKNRWASATLQRWLLGVLLNGGVALVGVGVSRLLMACMNSCR